MVESANELSITLDRDAASLANAVAENPRWQNDGWEIRNCDFRDSYQRVLIQGGNGGTLRDCRFTRIGSGICLDSNFFTRNEGGICRRIRIEDNVFEDMAIHPDGVTLQAGFQSLNHAASTPLLSDLTVRGNRFINTGRHAIDFRLVSGGEISGNTFTSTTLPLGDAWIATKQSKGHPHVAKPVSRRDDRDEVIKGHRAGQRRCRAHLRTADEALAGTPVAFWAANTASLVKVETSMPCQIPCHLSPPKRHGPVTA